MRTYVRLIGAAGMVLATLRAGAAGENLIGNGDFEAGVGAQAKAWSKFDGLTQLWQKTGGHPGACLRLDTSVLQVDKKQLEADEAAAAGAAKGRSKGGQYDTVGAHEGVWAFSQPVTIEPADQYFILEADVNGPAKSSLLFRPLIFVRGYKKFDPKKDAGTITWFQTPLDGGPAYSEQFGKTQRPAQEGDFLMVYRHTLVCRVPEPAKWFHFELGFQLPQPARYRPEVLLIKCYAFWPLGNYYFDNVSLRRASKAEFEASVKKGHSVKEFLPEP